MTFRVGLDARCLNTDFIRGMGDYVAPLVTAMSAMGDPEWFFFANRPDLPFHPPAGIGASKTVLRDVPGSRFNIWEQVAMPAQAWRAGVRVLHCTATTLPWWQPVPTIVTIHDTIPWDTGEFLPPGFHRDRLLPAALRKCAKIITISEHSRNDIVRIWPDLEPKVRIIRHGLNDRMLRDADGTLTPGLRAVGIKSPYLLYFGGTAERKRLAWTLQLYEALGETAADLVVCGVPAAAHDGFRQQLRPETRPRVVFAPYLEFEDMPSLYRNALAVLYPTLYEGFGVPALNAQAAGTPIIFSDVASLRELRGPTAQALHPDDRAGWLAACRQLIEQRLANSTPDEASRRWARQFTWSQSAAAHWDVYREVAGLPR